MFNREEPKRVIRLKSPIVPIIVVLLLGVQLFFPFKGWVILLSAFGGMWLISYIWSRSLKRGLSINRDMSFGWKQVGDRLRERVLLENNSWVPSLWVHVEDHSDMRDYEISSVTDVRGWRYRNWHTQGICNHRGLFTLGPVTLTAEDPFGIYEISVDYTESVNMMVVPPVVALPEIEIASGGRMGEGRSSNKGLKQTVSTVGVREYVPGDSLRWLHWPTIARTGNLYVHLFENEPTSDWWVLVDLDEAVQVGTGQRSTEEHGVMLAASLVNRGLQIGKHVGLITHGEDLIWHTPDLGDAHLFSVLRSLATVRPGEQPLDQILKKIKMDLGRNSSLIVITPNLSPEWISALESLKRMGIIPTVLLLDPVTFGGEGNAEGVQNRLRRLEITHHVITSDLLDRPQRQAKKAWEWLTSTRPTGEILDDWEIRWRRVKRFLRTWGLVALFYYVLANMLDGAVRGVELDLIANMITSGLLVGGVLSYTRWKGWLVGGLSILIGALTTILRVGNLGGKAIDFGLRSLRLAPEIFSWVYQSAEQPDYQPVLLRMDEIWTGVSALAVRLWGWGTGLARGQSYYDPVAITFLWSLAVWGLVVWSIWNIVRKKNPLTGLLPAVSFVGITVAVIGKTAYNLVFMIGVMIVMMTLVHHDVRERVWLVSQVNFTAGIRKNIVLASVLLTAGLMGFSLITPSVSIDSITNFVRDLSGETAEEETRFARSLGLENQAEGIKLDILDTARNGGLPNERLIGSGAELSEQVVMVVSLETPEELLLETPIYLRSLVYDKYTGRGWESRGTEIKTYSPGETLLDTKPMNGVPVRQQVKFLEDLNGFMYTVGFPNSADQDFKVAWRVRDNLSGIYDILGATVEGDTYRADSYLQIHSVEELRSAGQGYPTWISDRYLSLPTSVPENVLTLAIELTAVEATPYDRAVAIEQYLRKIPYSLSVSTGPSGSDIVEYFLFRLQKGYCDYYASAMVVLARAAGVPARYVVGYIGEYYDDTEGVYIITADQAHAWVEIFFPGYGWVPFEPTGGRPSMERPPEPFPELPADFELDLTPLVPERKFSFKTLGTIIWITVAGSFILGLAGWQIANRWMFGLPVDVLIPKLYKRIYRYARWAGLPVGVGDTPYHFSESLVNYLTQLGRECYWSDWVLEGSSMIRTMTAIFVQCLFSPQNLDVGSDEIYPIYLDLRYRLWMLWLLRKAYHLRFLRPLFWENIPLLIQNPAEEE